MKDEYGEWLLKEMEKAHSSAEASLSFMAVRHLLRLALRMNADLEATACGPMPPRRPKSRKGGREG
jgi:hypothetical protein